MNVDAGTPDATGAGGFAVEGSSKNDIARIHVVAGVIYNPERDKILIAKRPADSHQGGLWEFPGGKVAAGELAYQALCRELREELAIGVTAATPLLSESYDYPDKNIQLESWIVEGFTGSATGNEGQEIAWVALSDLGAYDFPAANRSILDQIRRPSV
ncbi:MAG: 8-oxo-dGTP diphosphatase MutT [Porticoccaceae bacterium]|nr:8-oxo-dGTP diphosphatase MutT [Porticoccaceae bacterium]